MLEDLRRPVTLRQEVGSVEHQEHGRVVHLAVNFRRQMAVRAHQVRLDLQPEGQVAAVARLGDLPQRSTACGRCSRGSLPRGG